MNRSRIVIALTISLLMLSTAAFAGIIFSPTGSHEVTSFPHTANVSATFSNSPNLCQTGEMAWELWVVGTNGTTVLKSTGGSYVSSGTPKTCPAGTSKEETLLDVIFPTAGTYTVRGTLKTVGTSAVNDAETDELEFTLEIDEPIVVDYPAAPAVANDLLKAAGKSNTVGKGKGQINLMQEVAHKMGPGTDFNGVAKSDVTAYRNAVKTFMNTVGAGL